MFILYFRASALHCTVQCGVHFVQYIFCIYILIDTTLYLYITRCMLFMYIILYFNYCFLLRYVIFKLIGLSFVLCGIPFGFSHFFIYAE
jgi:hypothetical protein